MTGRTFIEGLDSFEEARSMALPSASDLLLLTNELRNGSWPPLLVYVSMSLRNGLGFPRGTRIGRGEDLTLLDKINFGTAVGHPLLGLFRILWYSSTIWSISFAFWRSLAASLSYQAANAT